MNYSRKVKQHSRQKVLNRAKRLSNNSYTHKQFKNRRQCLSAPQCPDRHSPFLARHLVSARETVRGKRAPHHSTEKVNCKQCFLCCHRFLLECNLHCADLKNLSKVYNFLITLSFTQVQCERSFSKLKMIKSRLRSSLGQGLLESYMLMSTEVDLLNSIDIDGILSELCKESAEMKNLLSC